MSWTANQSAARWDHLTDELIAEGVIVDQAHASLFDLVERLSHGDVNDRMDLLESLLTTAYVAGARWGWPVVNESPAGKAGEP